jgi:aerobic-type carbon monoxide dehydrogenase small subunit (CoxS/CutS family)
MATITLTVNGERRRVDAAPDTPLLWVLRDNLGLTGTKYGCGSCVIPISSIEGQSVTTIEGLSQDGSHPVQQAWIEKDVPQCGYCQPGQIMTVASLLAFKPKPSDDEIIQALTGNLCRCGTYPRILEGVRRAVEITSSSV